MVARDDEPNIWTTASDGDIKELQRFLMTMQPDSADENGYTPLHAAASYGHMDMIRLLVETYKANVNVRDNEGDTPLHIICNLESCQLLVQLGAEPNLRNAEGKLPIECVYIEGLDEVVEFLQAFTPDYVKYEREVGDDAMLERVMNELEDDTNL